MTQFRSLVGILLLLALGAGSGCGLRNRCCVDRCGGNAGCLNARFDPILGDCSQCGVCGGKCPGYTPCGFFKRALTCGAGCGGEVYYGEWISDPPDCCDPCDNCGNWTGAACCAKRRPVANGLKTLWGMPYRGCCGLSGCGFWGGRVDSGCGGCGEAGCTGGGCASRGYPQASWNKSHDRAPMSEEALEEMAVRENPAPFRTSQPTPAQSPRRAAPQPKAELPTGINRASYSQASMPAQTNAYPPSRLR